MRPFIRMLSVSGVKRNKHLLPSSHHSDLQIHVREARTGASIESRGTIVFVHGTFTPGIAFDCSAPGYSWLHDAASNGFDAYAPDLRGYGQSSKLKLDPRNSPPFCRYNEAVHDIDDVVDFARAQTGQERVFLVGWSWGSLTTAMYTLRHPEKIDKLVLTSPLSYDGAMARHGKPPVATDPGGQLFAIGDFAVLADREDPALFNRKIGPYGRWSLTDSSHHALASMPPGDPDQWIDPVVAQAFAQDLREAMNVKDGFAESPTGAQNDLFEFYVMKREFYDPANLKTPTLIVRGEYDFANRAAGIDKFFSRLGAKNKAFIQLGNMSHNFFLERNAPFARSVVYSFLNSEPRLGEHDNG